LNGWIGQLVSEEKLEKLADQFPLGDPEVINASFFFGGASGMSYRMEIQN
jgi:hypothetical protein